MSDDEKAERDFRELTVAYQPDNRVLFTQGVMSADPPSEPIHVSQSIGGGWLFLDYRGKRYSVSVEKLAIAWVEAIRSDEA